MISLLSSPWVDAFNDLLRQVSSSLVVCSPFVGKAACRAVVDQLRLSGAIGQMSVYILTDLSRDNLLSGATDAYALQMLVDAVPTSRIQFLPSLHAKVYVADQVRAIVTSANLTASGLYRNYEYGLQITDHVTVAKIRDDVIRYGDLGSEVAVAELRAWAAAAAELKELQVAAMRDVKRRLRREFDRKVEALELDILRARTRGLAPNRIFERAVIYLLRDGPKTTRQIHPGIQAIHPDLCDDAVDRVIDGHHYGKKWKHAVRSAQQHLKEGAQIQYASGFWSLVTS
jgi:hypothetical protein